MTDEQQRNKELVRRYMQRLDELKKLKEPVIPILKEITDYLYPSHAGWDFEDVTSTAGELIFDGEAIASLSRLKDGLFGWLVNPSLDWLKMLPVRKADEENVEIMRYCAEVEMALYEIFSGSNFYDVMAQDIGDCAALGTSVIYAEPDGQKEKPVYTPIPISEFYISEDRFGHVDTVYREFEMLNRHVLEQFNESLLENQRKTMSRAPDVFARVLHAMEPRVDYIDDGRVKMKDELPFASSYILMGSGGSRPLVTKTGTLLEEGGTSYQRSLAWRFEKRPRSPYGYCPGMSAIYDTKMINLQSKTMADAGQLAAKPPYQAPESLRGKVKVNPGGITYRTGDEEVKPLMTSISYPIGMDAMERRARIIREHFKTEYFMATSQIQQGSRERTKAEIMEMKAESAATLGSVIGRIQSERLDPLVMLTIQMGAEHGWLPKPPKSLGKDYKFKIRYMGPLMQSQRKYIRVQGLTQGLAAMGQMMRMYPDAIYNAKLNDATRELMTASGFPFEFLEEKRAVEQAQAQAAEARAKAEAAQMQNERLAAAGRGARAAEPGSPTAALMGGGQ